MPARQKKSKKGKVACLHKVTQLISGGNKHSPQGPQYCQAPASYIAPERFWWYWGLEEGILLIEKQQKIFCGETPGWFVIPLETGVSSGDEDGVL